MADAPRQGAPPLVLYVVTEDWFFASHFLPMAREAQSLGFATAVVTRVNAHRDAIETAGVRVIPLDFERGGRGPLAIARQIRRLTRLMRQENPAIVHCIALRSIVVGGLAARRAGVPARILAVTGMGHLWASEGLGTAIWRGLVRFAIRRLRGSGTVFLFENHDDPAAIGLDGGDDVAFVPGAGVDPAAFPPQPEPVSPPVRVAIVARMLWAKGIGTAVEAMRRLRADGVNVVLDIWGTPDPSNPGSIPERQLRDWGAEPGIVWRGATGDVAAVWARSHIALLPSHYREGVPKALVEAMASGRPVVTTDVPGCRELVRDGIDGLVVPKENPRALATAIRSLAEDAVRRRAMGAAALERFREGYTAGIVGERIAALYRRLA